jgi:hypothetical protein
VRAAVTGLAERETVRHVVVTARVHGLFMVELLQG